ncbi:MAG: putative ral secretion pathway protein [Chlamydiota bacterium]|jgi:general secretion pathway protein F/type IV pilus assembly protein PilC
MPLFSYQAISAVGKGIKGVIDADSISAAKERLVKQRICVVSVKELRHHEKTLCLKDPLLLSFTRELAGLLQAGLPLYESLLTIEEKYRRHPAHPLFLDLCDHLKEGGTLSSALKKYPSTFDQIYLSMVKVGEQSGHLSEVFDQLFGLISRKQRLKKQLSSALTYPAFLSIFCFLIICALLFFIVPSMRELFEDRPVHPVTAAVLMISRFANDHILSLLGLGIGSITACVFGWQRATFRLKLYSLCLRIPFVKSILLHTALMRFCTALAMLLSSGVPLLEALQLSKAVIKSPLLEDTIARAEKKVLQGEKLSSALKNAALIPPLVLRMLSLSEETGKMGDAFANLAKIYDEEMEKHLSQLSAYLQPALLITLGAIVGLVVLSILLPLTDVSSFNAGM